MSMRKDIADFIGEQRPEWKVVDVERDIDRVERPTVVVRLHTFRWNEQLGRLMAVFVVTILTPHVDSKDSAETDAEELVEKLLGVLIDLGSVRVTGGSKVRFGERGWPGWDVELETIIERKL